MQARIRRALLAAIILALGGCAPPAADDGSTTGELTKLMPNTAGLPITLSAASPSKNFSFTCEAPSGDGCLVRFDFGVSDATYGAYFGVLNYSEHLGDLSYKSLFSIAKDGVKRDIVGWWVPAGCEGIYVPPAGVSCPFGARSFTGTSMANLAPGTYDFGLARSRGLPVGMPELALSVTAVSQITPCVGDCQATPTPNPIPSPLSLTLVAGSLVDATSVDGQTIPLADEPVRLRWSDVQPRDTIVTCNASLTCQSDHQVCRNGACAQRDYTTTTLGDGSFTLDDVQLGHYELVIRNHATQLPIDQSPLYDLGQLID